MKNICLVLDALAFERLLGPCMDIMKRNEETYKEMLANAFNRKVKIIQNMIYIYNYIEGQSGKWLEESKL